MNQTESSTEISKDTKISSENPNFGVPCNPQLVRLGIYFGLLLIAFSNVIVKLVQHALATDLHSHIILIPFVTLYLLKTDPRCLMPDYRGTPVLTAVFVLLGAVSLAAAFTFPGIGISLSANDRLTLTTFSFVSLLISGSAWFLGERWIRSAVFPLGFLVFMIPLPDIAVAKLEIASQHASAEVASWLFSITGTPVFREGLIFQLPGITLQVAQECSGIRSSWVLFVTSALAAYLFLKHPVNRFLLVAIVVPLAILRNGFRILTIGMMCVHIGPEMIHSIVHRKGGPFFFVVSLFPLFVVIWLLRRHETCTEIRRASE